MTRGQGWFPTGDVALIDADGYMQITDRSKDVIKSGGEWIGSIDLENIAMAHPAVAMAACIAAFHPKWDERPLLVVMKKPGAELTREQMLAFFDGKIAKWWTPDDVVFVDAIPLGATGKMQKNKLREMFKDHKLPTAAKLRFDGRLRRLPCGAQSHGLVANSLRALRALRSDSRDEVRARGALRALAMGPALLGASQAHRGLPGPVFAATLVAGDANKPRRDLATGGTRQGRFLRRRGAQRRGRRASARFVLMLAASVRAQRASA